MATSRKLAARLMVVQALATFVTGMVCLPWGWHHVMAAWVGGALVTVGSALLAARGLSRGSPGAVLGRMFLGMLLRWIVVLGGLFVVLVRLKWPPAPLIAGLVAALLAPLLLRTSREP